MTTHAWHLQAIFMPLFPETESSYSLGLELTRTKLLIKARFTCLQIHTQTHTLNWVCASTTHHLPHPHNWVVMKLELIPGTTPPVTCFKLTRHGSVTQCKNIRHVPSFTEQA
jgi:hypothetical protein